MLVKVGNAEDGWIIECLYTFVRPALVELV
jgi:hypothetical protein